MSDGPDATRRPPRPTPLTRAQRRAAPRLRTVPRRVRRAAAGGGLWSAAVQRPVVLTRASPPSRVAGWCSPLALAGLVVAWGWARAARACRARLAPLLAIGVAAAVGCRGPDHRRALPRLVPVALARRARGAFVHQLVRRDGRPRLTESIAVSSLGLAVVALGVTWMPLPRTAGGRRPWQPPWRPWPLSALADLCPAREGAALDAAPRDGARRRRRRGGGARRPSPIPAPAALVGFLVAAVAHATRRILAVLPAVASARGAAWSPPRPPCSCCGVGGLRARPHPRRPDARAPSVDEGLGAGRHDLLDEGRGPADLRARDQVGVR